jgi:hypothetical protein
MNLLEIGRVSEQTQTNAHAILANDTTPTSYSPKRYCFDNRPGGTAACQEVLQDGKVGVVNFTTNPDCMESPFKRADCFP